MTPEQLRAAAIGLALLTVVLLGLAAKDWLAPTTGKESDSVERSGCQGGLILFLVSILLVGAILVTADLAGWNRDRAMWISMGTFLAALTLARPWWFWENYRARWLRGIIGDEATAVLYILLAGTCLWVGLNTNWTFGRHR